MTDDIRARLAAEVRQQWLRKIKKDPTQIIEERWRNPMTIKAMCDRHREVPLQTARYCMDLFRAYKEMQWTFHPFIFEVSDYESMVLFADLKECHIFVYKNNDPQRAIQHYMYIM